MRIIKTLVIILLSTGYLASAHGQSSDSNKIYRLALSGADSTTLNEAGLLDVFEEMVTSEEGLIRWMNLVYEQGYLLASYELESNAVTSRIVQFSLNQRFRWAELSQGNLPDEILTSNGYKSSFFDQQFVNFKRISGLFEDVLTYSEQNGYPFASIRLRTLEIEQATLSAELDFQPGPFITFDSLKLINSNRIKPAFLSAYLKIRPGMVYDQRKVDNIISQINTLPYLSIISAPELYFANQQCQISLELEDERASSFDGILGFMPNENEEGKLLLTGQVYLRLENLFRSGKGLEVNWRRMNIQSQDLSLSYDHPALFRMPVDLGFSFRLYKQDTSFITRNTALDLVYHNYRNGRFGFQYARVASRLLQAEPVVENGKPLFADYNLNLYGFLFRFRTLDHQNFPTRGWHIMLDADLGNKNILRNQNLGDSLYTNIPGTGLQWQTTFSIARYLTLRPRNIMQLKVAGGLMGGDQLFLNDLFRLGGLRSIRGFNDLFFYATGYVIGTLEYRYLFENESQLFVFIDGSSMQLNLDENATVDFPVGTGAGISLSTPVGLLNLVYALGRSDDQPFSFRYSKIHIGYTGRF